ncbi:hypothetical protein BCR44DRAFT_63347 [Catenaria anguillulae PL171]|uniref:GRAM domain-containing protein n=1 Tax=Catenaria anguillulae PL171 TaxID=765915 RepID=A0A1Y2HR48_9FUNG|nr:hypothetical protein BCR44DRAFT_63347 [Catenaria anguillulae PL171]
MALNWTILNADASGPLPLPNEKLFSSFEDVRLELECGNGYPGAGASYYVKRGQVVLTSHRVVYFSAAYLEHAANQLASASTAASASSSSASTPPPAAFTSFQSLSVPLRNIQDPKINQPWFGTNYVELTAVPVPNGGLPMPASVKFFFDKGGAFEMYSQLATIMQRGLPDVTLHAPTVIPAEEPLPLYPGAAPAGPSPPIHAPAPGELPPAYHGEAPRHVSDEKSRPVE